MDWLQNRFFQPFGWNNPTYWQVVSGSFSFHLFPSGGIFFIKACALVFPEIDLRIKITNSGKSVYATIDKSHIAKTIWDILPLSGKVSVWGGEVKLRISIHLDEKDPTDNLSLGDIAFWPIDNAICIYTGPTPISVSDKVIRPALPVCVFGSIKENLELLSGIQEKDKIRIERS